jgi:hypothetical protein
MKTLNLVYMHVKPPTGCALRRGDVQLLWSTLPVDGCDFYVYQDAFNYTGRKPAPQALMVHEPVSVLPGQYDFDVWKHFDAFLTTMDALIERSPKFRKFYHHTYQWGSPPDPIPTFDELVRRYPSEGRRHAVCMILGNKTSRVPHELYSKRAEIARWFHENSPIPFDAYGMPPYNLPNYKGAPSQADKLPTIARYRFNICFENIYHPVWARGYVSDRIAHSFESRTVPIYYGCPNVEDYIPRECFIDLRDFANYESLSAFLEGMSDDVYAAYVAAIDRWLERGGLHEYSCLRLYDAITRLFAELTDDDAEQLFAGDETWHPAETPENLPVVGATSVPVYWTWQYLQSKPFAEVEGTLERLESEPSSVGRTNREAPRGVAPRMTELRIRKLLYVGARYTGGVLSLGLDPTYLNVGRAFASYPDLEFAHFDYAERVHAIGVAAMSEELLRFVRESRPDALVYVPTTVLLDVLHETMQDIAETTHTRILLWMTDDPWAIETYSRYWAPFADVVVTSSATAVKRYRELGLGDRVVLSPPGFHPGSYYPLTDERKRHVVVVADANPARERLVAAIQANALPIETFGRGWLENRDVSHAERLRLYGEAKINLVLDGYRSLLNVIGCGGFAVTFPAEDLTALFNVESEGQRRFAEVVELAADGSDLLERLRYYLTHDREREAIAKRAYDRALREHTCYRRFTDLFARLRWEFPSPPALPS